MKANLVRTFQGLLYADDDSRDVFKKFDIGAIIACEVKAERNYKFHNKFFSMLRAGFDNQDKYDAFEPFRREVTIRCGYYSTHIMSDGAVCLVPESIAFDRLEPDQFEKLYAAAIDVLIDNFSMDDAAAQQIIDYV